SRLRSLVNPSASRWHSLFSKASRMETWRAWRAQRRMLAELSSASMTATASSSCFTASGFMIGSSFGQWVSRNEPRNRTGRDSESGSFSRSEVLHKIVGFHNASYAANSALLSPLRHRATNPAGQLLQRAGLERSQSVGYPLNY